MCNGEPCYITGSHYIYTSTGQRLMLERLILDKPIEYSFISGRLARLINDPMGCAILRTDDLGFLSWHHQRLLTKPLHQKILGLGYYQNLELMRRRCLQTKWYPYQSITRSFLNQSRTEWNDQRRSYPIRYHQEDLPEIPYKKPVKKKLKGVWIQPSIGRIQETTRMMERNYNYSSMMNRGNGKDRII